MLFKSSLDDLHKDRVDINYEESTQIDDIDNLQIDVSIEYANRILSALESNLETDIYSSYKILTILCRKNFLFPQDRFPLVIRHTLSENSTLAEHSQRFLTSLFEMHPMVMEMLPQLIDLEYFKRLIDQSFSGETSNFLIAIFKYKSSQTKEFKSFFFDLFFSEIIKQSIDSPDFYLRLVFIQKYIYTYPNNDQTIYEKTHNFLLSYFPYANQFDRDLLVVFLSITGRCINNIMNEKWLIDFIEGNFVDSLISLYSNGDNEINFYVTLSICGLSGCNKDISSTLLNKKLINFFANNFSSCKNEHIQFLIVRTIINLLIYDDRNMPIINNFVQSQLFLDIIKIASKAQLKLKKEIINLICFLVQKLKSRFFELFIKLKMIFLFIDALQLTGSTRTKKDVINALVIIVSFYQKTNDADIEKLLLNEDLVDAIDDFIDNSDQENPNDVLDDALNIQYILRNL